MIVDRHLGPSAAPLAFSGLLTAVTLGLAVGLSTAACGGHEAIYVSDSAEIPNDARRYAGPSGYPRLVEAGTDEECPVERDTMSVDLATGSRAHPLPEGQAAAEGEEAGEDPDGNDPRSGRRPCVSAAERERQELIALARGPVEGDEPTADGTELGAESGPTVLATFEGRASYYSSSLGGRRTANGERYDPDLFTAASRDLPFDTVVRVTRTDTLESVVVRINDRGPFGDERRILDLSRAAAARINMIRAGIVEIRAEVIAMPSER